MKGNRSILTGGVVIVLAALAAYHNSFSVPFHFDDLPSILQNPSIQSFATAWSPPNGFGFTVSGRPLLNFSLAVNYAISGTEVRSYHGFNFVIHALAALTLFGVVRRTLLRPASRFEAQSALPVALGVALLWAVHPLQTESVTYVIQRAESLMGLFYLLTLYGFVRAVESPRPARWLLGSVIACLLGTGCKEVIVTAPLVVWLYDRTFVAGSFMAAWRARRGYYVGLMAAWLPLIWFVVGTGGDRGGTFAYSPAAFGNYWLTQAEALVRYLQLSVWPSPLVFDYGAAQPQVFGVGLLYALPVAFLLGATGWALVRRPVWGFPMACFFLILLPTSLVPGVNQVMVEHRMYLPLAAVLAMGGVAAFVLSGRRALIGGVVLTVGAGWLTVQRNADYRDDLTLWQDTLAKRPLNARAHSSVGSAYYNRGEVAKALTYYETAVHLEPGTAQLHYNLGLALQGLGRFEEAITHFQEAVRILPYYAQAQVKMGLSLLKLGRPTDAVAPLRQATSGLIEPAEAYFGLGQAQYELGEFAEALSTYEQALKSRSGLAEVHFALGLTLAQLGRGNEALAQYAEAVRLQPDYAEARLNLGIGLAQGNRSQKALVQLEEAVRLQPGLAEGHANLGIVLAETGRVEEAVRSYGTALRLRPDYAVAHYNLGNALLQLSRESEARQHFAEAVRLRPDFAAAREMLERLGVVSNP